MFVEGCSVHEVSTEIGVSANSLYRFRKNIAHWLEHQDRGFRKEIAKLKSQLQGIKERRTKGERFDALKKQNRELRDRNADLKAQIKVSESKNPAAHVSAVKVTPGPAAHSPRHKFPKNRGECWHGSNEERPCPWVRCRHHLAVKSIGRKQIHLIAEPEDMEHTCALDVAESGPKTLEEIGEYLGGLTRERVRQIQDVALEKLLDRFPELLTEMRWDV